MTHEDPGFVWTSMTFHAHHARKLRDSHQIVAQWYADQRIPRRVMRLSRGFFVPAVVSHLRNKRAAYTYTAGDVQFRVGLERIRPAHAPTGVCFRELTHLAF